MKTLQTFVYGIIAGVCIAIGGCAFLSLDNKVLGATFFVVGLFTICSFGFNLFTGKVCYVLDNDGKYAMNLIPIWLGNLVGTVITGLLINLTRVAPAMQEKAMGMVDTKLSDGLLSVFILAIFCNILIFIAVEGFKTIEHGIGKYLALYFGVTVFILCGFEHCVANMFYITVAGGWSGKAIVFILINTLGNALGGLVIPVAKKLTAEK